MTDRDALLTGLDRLEAAVTELRTELTAARGAMRDTRRCPACGGRELLHIREPQFIGYRGHSRRYALVSHRTSWFDSANRGLLEAYVCRACLLVEWHACDLKDVIADGTQVVALDPDPAPPRDGPFR